MSLCTSVFCCNFSFFISNFIVFSLPFILMTLANGLSFCLTSQRTSFWFYWSLLLSPSSLFHLLLSDIYALLLLTVFFFFFFLLEHDFKQLLIILVSGYHGNTYSFQQLLYSLLGFLLSDFCLCKNIRTNLPWGSLQAQITLILACDTNRPSWGCKAPVPLWMYSDTLDRFVRAQVVHL